MAAALAVVAAPAFAADNVSPDGDTAHGGPNASFSATAGTCGSTLHGALTVSYNGLSDGGHFAAGESLVVTFTTIPAGVHLNLGTVPQVPSSWQSNSDSFDIPFTTSVDSGSVGGKVEVNVKGATSLNEAGDGAGGKPNFQVQVTGCTVTPPVDTTPPVITYTLSPATPNGKDGSGWWVSPVTVDWTVTDPDSVITSQSGCDDTTVSSDTAGVTFTCSATSAGGTATKTTETIMLDSHGPTLDHPTASIDVCGAGKPAMTWSDALSGVDPATVTAGSWSQSGSGLGATFTYTGSAADNAGNQTTDATQTYTASSYGSAFSGVLQPVNADGSSRFKLGSTIPVKFRLSCDGVAVTNATARLRVSQGDTAPDAGTDETVSTASSTTGNLFRYDATDQQYIFNLSTKVAYGNPDGSKISSFSAGTWTLAIDLGDGVNRNVKIQLVK